MMAATTSGYGAYNPAAVDPYPIESVLAKIVGEANPINAQNMLNTYQVQRETDAGNYGHEMALQHDFAKQQLAQQLQEQYLKSGMDAVQHRGGLTVMDAIAPGSLGNLSLADRASLEGGLTGLQNAKILEQSGAGAKSAAEAGRDITDDQAARASNGLLGPYGTPLSTRNIMLKEAGSNARHASGPGGPGNLSVTIGDQPDYPGMTFSGRVPKGMDLPTWKQQQIARGLTFPTATALPDKDGTAPTKPGTDTPAPKGRTGLPNNTRPAAQAPAGNDIHSRVEANVENKVRTSNPDAYKDIVAGKVGGKVNIVGQTPDGRPVVQGKSGQHYQ
jgi:hypothetical protein